MKRLIDAIIKKWLCGHEWELLFTRDVEVVDDWSGNSSYTVYHYFCKKCGKVIDLFDEKAPKMTKQKVIEGNIVDEKQLYYKGICADCAKLNEEKKRKAK